MHTASPSTAALSRRFGRRRRSRGARFGSTRPAGIRMRTMRDAPALPRDHAENRRFGPRAGHANPIEASRSVGESALPLVGWSVPGKRAYSCGRVRVKSLSALGAPLPFEPRRLPLAPAPATPCISEHAQHGTATAGEELVSSSSWSLHWNPYFEGHASPRHGGGAVKRKVAPEVLDHVAQLDFTDAVSERPPFGVLCALSCSRCSPCSVRGAPARARLDLAARRGSAAGRVTAASACAGSRWPERRRCWRRCR